IHYINAIRDPEKNPQVVLATDPDRGTWNPRECGFKSLQDQVQKPYLGYANPDPDPCLCRRIRIRDRCDGGSTF
uniref:Uncharacterized protein n=1 Tax=Romanomermis culicivorax TaxID=13658 RepID=A0A915J153_ROMCU